MEITREYDEECDVLNLKGVLVALLSEYLDDGETAIDIEHIANVADYWCQMLYDYACCMTKDNEIPAIVFVHGAIGEFHPIEVPEEPGEEVM